MGWLNNGVVGHLQVPNIRLPSGATSVASVAINEKRDRMFVKVGRQIKNLIVHNMRRHVLNQTRE